MNKKTPPPSKKKLSLIILAAGMSRRMGTKNKLLLPLNINSICQPMLIHVLSNIQQINPKLCSLEKIIVLGHERGKLQNLLRPFPELLCAYNHKFYTGMTSSIQCGVQAASADTCGYMLCPSDLPWLSTQDYETLIIKFFSNNLEQRRIFRPIVKKKPGHPVIFSFHFQKQILSHDMPNGCKKIIEDYRENLHEVQFQSNSWLKDIDTLAQYPPQEMEQ